MPSPFAALAGFMAYFFRDPDRRVPADASGGVSPADGEVMVAGPGEPDVAPPGQWKQISIFLSPIDVHINRIPYGGRVTRIEYQPGQFLPAYKAESAPSTNATRSGSNATAAPSSPVRSSASSRGASSAASRRATRCAPGERFGLMKFGSRMDVFVPPEARLVVTAGQKVRGGESILARFEEGG